MKTEDFERGETKQKLQNISQKVGEIKTEMVSHNLRDEKEFEQINQKIDKVSDKASMAVTAAIEAANKVQRNEGTMNDRHEENKLHLEKIEGKIDLIAAKQAKTDGSIGKIMAISGAVGFVAGSVAPYVTNLMK